jgi:hypothetical protein
MNKQLLERCKKADFKAIFKEKGYKFFTEGIYNLNLIGVRSKESVHQSNTFDDAFIAMYVNELGDWRRDIISITTDPGITMLKAPINSKGCAILVPGQYPGLWKIGFHKGKYKALVQNKPCTIYRDNNKDDILDFNPDNIDLGMFGINFHKAGLSSIEVNNWSAGCQVAEKTADFNIIMKVAEEGRLSYGNSFTYTLLEEIDL